MYTSYYYASKNMLTPKLLKSQAVKFSAVYSLLFGKSEEASWTSAKARTSV